ncbi:MAG: DUF167 domain-containing protein [Acidimicrobiia bacterium]
MPDAIRPFSHGVIIDVLVVPNARRSEVVGRHGDRIKVRLASPPERNKANDELLTLLKRTFGVRTARITAGRTHRWKTIEMEGTTVEGVTTVIRG